MNQTDARKITELICHRIADKDREKLTEKFWQVPKWRKTYQRQIIAANSLLKLYSAKVILKALKDNPRIYSLRFPKLHDICDTIEYSLKKEKLHQKDTKLEIVDKVTKPRQLYGKQTILSKLKD